jgi:septin family protein
LSVILMHIEIVLSGPNAIGKASFVNSMFDQVVIPKRKALIITPDVDLTSYVPVSFTEHKLGGGWVFCLVRISDVLSDRKGRVWKKTGHHDHKHR